MADGTFRVNNNTLHVTSKLIAIILGCSDNSSYALAIDVADRWLIIYNQINVIQPAGNISFNKGSNKGSN